MSDYKIMGHCTQCDARCFEIMAVHGAHERLPGEPKQIGPPVDGVMRITYMLIDGTKTSLTFCADCAAQITPVAYLTLWQKVMRSWKRELSEKPETERSPDWFHSQFANGLLCEMGRIPWTQLVKNNG